MRSTVERTRSLTLWLTSGWSLRTRETVLTLTPQALAISFMVISAFSPLPYILCRFSFFRLESLPVTFPVFFESIVSGPFPFVNEHPCSPGHFRFLDQRAPGFLVQFDNREKAAPFFQGLPLVRFYKKFQSLTSISRPNSLGRKRGQTFSDRVITEAASLVPICMASSMVFP